MEKFGKGTLCIGSQQRPWGGVQGVSQAGSQGRYDDQKKNQKRLSRGSMKYEMHSRSQPQKAHNLMCGGARGVTRGGHRDHTP